MGDFCSVRGRKRRVWLIPFESCRFQEVRLSDSWSRGGQPYRSPLARADSDQDFEFNNSREFLSELAEVETGSRTVHRLPKSVQILFD